jgi:hypothetical protein
LKGHPVKRVPARKHRGTQVQFKGRQPRGMKRVYDDILKDHRLDPQEFTELIGDNRDETLLPGDDLFQHGAAMPEFKTSGLPVLRRPRYQGLQEMDWELRLA